MCSLDNYINVCLLSVILFIVFVWLIFEYLHALTCANAFTCIILHNLHHSSIENIVVLTIWQVVLGMESLVKDRTRIQVSESRVQSFKVLMTISSSVPVLFLFVFCIVSKFESRIEKPLFVIHHSQMRCFSLFWGFRNIVYWKTW